jgi:hypothetical protein
VLLCAFSNDHAHGALDTTATCSHNNLAPVRGAQCVQYGKHHGQYVELVTRSCAAQLHPALFGWRTSHRHNRNSTIWLATAYARGENSQLLPWQLVAARHRRESGICTMHCRGITEEPYTVVCAAYILCHARTLKIASIRRAHQRQALLPPTALE